uniref:U5 small nuclear ribonucleoprotein TSSC4 n=1 Tax=Oreochromis niloticus TaxID=8128 RepID=A0A669BT79_ORENI
AATSSFSLSGGTSAFSDRSHSIFDCLDSIGRQTFSSLNQNTVADKSSLHSQNTSHPSSTCPTPPKKRLVPDYLVHPERWTHYSLEDVNESSDQENSRGGSQCFIVQSHMKRTFTPHASSSAHRCLFCFTQQRCSRVLHFLLQVSSPYCRILVPVVFGILK